jgi:hypothetical protein
MSFYKAKHKNFIYRLIIQHGRSLEQDNKTYTEQEEKCSKRREAARKEKQQEKRNNKRGEAAKEEKQQERRSAGR